MQIHITLWMAVFLAIGIISVAIQAQDDAMAVCQLSHSFDTCHEALNP